jgi:uncharacterized coiled-coil DUF342 family protein
MASDKTPAHKRISRAEKGRDEWKMKATERREEIEKLKEEIQGRDRQLIALSQKCNELKEKTDAYNKTIKEQHRIIDSLKKKPIR